MLSFGNSLRKRARVIGLTLVSIGTLCSFGASSAAPTLETVYSFKGKPTDGASPIDGLVQGPSAVYYGVTAYGGAHDEGSLFQLTVSEGRWTEKLLYSFNDTFGSFPGAQVIVDKQGALYGTTEHGSAAGQGVVYKLIPPKTAGGQWALSILYKFPGGQLGQEPRGRLVMDAAGALYGTTYNGGDSASAGGTKCSFGCGGVFKLAPPAKAGGAWTYSVLYKFQQGADGSHPVKGLVIDRSGALYGTTLNGGNQNCNNGIDLGCGVVFKLTPPAAGKSKWTERVIYRIADNNGGNSTPSDLFIDGSFNVFGGAPTGGANKVGAIYELSPVRGGPTYTSLVVHAFTAATEISGLVADSKGTLYGTLSAAGPYGFGGVFKLNPPATTGKPWTYGNVEGFFAAAGHPLSNLLEDSNGSFLGVTQRAGAHHAGTVYQLTP